MVSGIAAPSIVPLRVKGNFIDDGKSKFDIDTSTPIELKCPQQLCEILYSTNGATPDPYARGSLASFTNKYDKPFYLPVGKFLIKTVAITNKGCQSPVNAKLFRVSQGPRQRKDMSVDNDFRFMKDLFDSDMESLELNVSRSALLRHNQDHKDSLQTQSYFNDFVAPPTRASTADSSIGSHYA